MDDGRLGVLSNNNEILCAVSVGLREPDAKLISAAPDMAAALKASLALGNKVYHNANAHEAVNDWATVKRMMMEALAKAGVSP